MTRIGPTRSKLGLLAGSRRGLVVEPANPEMTQQSQLRRVFEPWIGGSMVGPERDKEEISSVKWDRFKLNLFAMFNSYLHLSSL